MEYIFEPMSFHHFSYAMKQHRQYIVANKAIEDVYY